MNIFITGGTTGIGLSLAELYLKEGHRVGICGRNLSKFPSEIKNKYKQLSLYEVNVTDRDQLFKAVNDFSCGHLDIMIANAGRSVGAKSKTPNFAVACEVIDINVKGVLHAFDVALTLMLPKKKGHLVATASVAGFVGLPGASSYSASKAAVLKLCESYSLDLKNHGIDVTAIAPGFVDTPLTQKNNHKMPFMMSSSRAAELIKRAISKKRVLYIFPWQMKIVITILDKMPRCLYRFIMNLKMLNYSEE